MQNMCQSNYANGVTKGIRVTSGIIQESGTSQCYVPVGGLGDVDAVGCPRTLHPTGQTDRTAEHGVVGQLLAHHACHHLPRVDADMNLKNPSPYCKYICPECRFEVRFVDVNVLIG